MGKTHRWSGRKTMFRGKALLLIRRKCAGEKIVKIVKLRIHENKIVNLFVFLRHHGESECEVEEEKSDAGLATLPKKGGGDGLQGNDGSGLDKNTGGKGGAGDNNAVWSRSDSGYIFLHPENNSHGLHIIVLYNFDVIGTREEKTTTKNLLKARPMLSVGTMAEAGWLRPGVEKEGSKRETGSGTSLTWTGSSLRYLSCTPRQKCTHSGH